MKKNFYTDVLYIYLFFMFCSSGLKAQYCASNATSTIDSKIDQIILVGESTTINQGSAGPCQTYTDYTSLAPADLMIGNNYTIEITLGTCGGNYNKSANIYIDLNQDHDFDDAGESIGTTGIVNPTTTVSVDFTLGGPCAVTPVYGTTRMRIVLSEGTPNDCGTYTYGETEDYTVTILANPSAPSYGQFYLIGDAIQTSPQCMQLTAATNGQLGMAWDISNTLDFASGFSYDFMVNLGNDNGGADGMMFIIQNDPNLHCVLPSGGWGAGNVSNSLSIEIDTYLNTEDRDDGIPGVLCSGGPSPDHLDIWLNGVVNPSGTCSSSPGARVIPAAVPLLDAGVDYDIENGLDHVFRVTWTPGVGGALGTLTAVLMDAGASTIYGTVSHSFDPMTIFGTLTPIYGISGSTGGLNNEQSFCIPAILLGDKVVDFSANLNLNEGTDLQWTVNNQQNTDYFVVEKSDNGIDFETLEEIKVQHNYATYTYVAIDPTPWIGMTYYRLKQVHLDGSISYSILKAVERKEITGDYIQIFPNPVDDQLTVELKENIHVQVALRNQLGQVIPVLSTHAGNRVTLDLTSLQAGIYLLEVKEKNKTAKVFKVVKN